MTEWYDEEDYSAIKFFRTNLLLFVLIINDINLIDHYTPAFWNNNEGCQVVCNNNWKIGGFLWFFSLK